MMKKKIRIGSIEIDVRQQAQQEQGHRKYTARVCYYDDFETALKHQIEMLKLDIRQGR